MRFVNNQNITHETRINLLLFTSDMTESDINTSWSLARQQKNALNYFNLVEETSFLKV